MPAIFRVVFSLFISILLCVGCDRVTLQGSLLVHHTDAGSYEVYKIASESPLQFVSEQTGAFNDPLNLMPGSYLVLADCSSQVVNIYPGSRVKLTAHKINFIPMLPPKTEDKFSIQCLRSERTHSRQHLVNRFSLAVLAGKRDLLVGMVPLQVNLEDQPNEIPRLVSFPLSSVSIETPAVAKNDSFDFFVSPTSEMAPYTESQKSGHRLYLLKGQYQIQLNGTSTNIDLAEGEARTILPATLRVDVNPTVDLELAAKIKGSPLYIEINGEHFLHLNTPYSVLPGTIRMRLSNTIRPTEVLTKEGEFIKLKAKSVIVSLGCNPDDWACLGSRKVKLFEKGKPYHFAESVTDIPVLYMGESIAVGVEGSRNIKYELTSAEDQNLKVGFVEVIPTPTHRSGVLTDLVRIEPTQSNLIGASLDLALDKPSVLPLVAGSYQLAQYTFFAADGSRRKSATALHVSHGERVKLSITTFLSEKRMSSIDPEFSAPDEKTKSLQ